MALEKDVATTQREKLHGLVGILCMLQNILTWIVPSL